MLLCLALCRLIKLRVTCALRVENPTAGSEGMKLLVCPQAAAQTQTLPTLPPASRS